MTRENIVRSIHREVCEYFDLHPYSHTLRLPMLDYKGDVVATANSLRSIGYKTVIRSLEPIGHELIIIKH